LGRFIRSCLLPLFCPARDAKGRDVGMIPATYEAGPLEAGQICPFCQEPIRRGQSVARCPRCNHLQHAACWEQAGACRSYECQEVTSAPPERRTPEVFITQEEIRRTVPVPAPARPSVVSGDACGSSVPPSSRRLSALAVTAFCLSLVGVFLFGVPGLLAIVFGAVSAGAINARKDLRGLAFASAGIIIGMLAVVGWTAGLALYLLSHEPGSPPIITNPPHGRSISLEDLEEVNEPIRDAIRSNVAVSVHSGVGYGAGSGVIVEKRGEQVRIITNRHVVSSPFGLGGGKKQIGITFFDGQEAEGQLLWEGGSKLDLAVISCALPEVPLSIAHVRATDKLVVGEPVFAVGNPLGLGWSYASGVISAVRAQHYEDGELRLIQAQVPLNPGNSGGGLYDEQGNLIGINTMVADQRVGQGIGFAIAVPDVVEILSEKAGVNLRTEPTDAASGGSESP